MEPGDPIARLSDGFFLSAHCPGWIFPNSRAVFAVIAQTKE